MHRISLEYLAIVLSTAGVYSTEFPVLLEIKLADITSLTLLVGVSVRAHATMYYTRVLLNCPALASVQDKRLLKWLGKTNPAAELSIPRTAGLPDSNVGD